MNETTAVSETAGTDRYVSGLGLRQANRFPPYHPWDRNFFAIWLAAIWFAMIAGFGNDMIERFQHHTLDFPWIVYPHAAVYVGWLLLLTSQIVLIRRRNIALHRRMGMLALVLLPLMAILGPATAIVVDRVYFGNPHLALPPEFLGTQFTNVLGCVVLLGAGFVLRTNSSAHKRLMLMGTLAITEPGFARFLAHPLYLELGSGAFVRWVEHYVATAVLMVGVGVYDYITRRRLHPAYVISLVFILTLEIWSAWVYYQPWWRTLTLHMVGH